MGRIVVTGATGFLGGSLCAAFLERGDVVYALVRPGSPRERDLPSHKDFHIVHCAMEHARACAGEIGCADAWFHFAWGGVNREEIDSPQVQEKNIQSSLECVRTAALLGCQTFFDAGSRVEYGVPGAQKTGLNQGTADAEPVGLVMSEELECHPLNEYGKAKLSFFNQAAPICQAAGVKYCHLRFFSVYGYGDHPWSIISTLIRELRAGRSVELSACLHKWNFMYIKDAIRAVLLVYDQVRADILKGPLIVNIAGRDTRVLKSFVEEIQSIIGKQGRLRYGAFVQAKEGALSVCPDISRLARLTGFQEEYTFRQGVEETIKKEMEHGHEED